MSRDKQEPLTFFAIEECRSVTELCDVIANGRGRHLKIMPFPLRGTGVHGMLLATDDVDFIVYDQDAPAYHQEHIQLHELSHVLYGHLDEPSGPQDAQLGHEFAQLHSLGAVRVLRRTDYSDRMEREAEALATTLGARMRVKSSLDDDMSLESKELRRISRSLSRPSPRVMA